MNRFDRRSVLGTIGCGLAALAGCSDRPTGNETGPSGDNGTSGDGITAGELPPYADVLTDSGGSTTFFGAIDVETMFELFDDDPESETESHDDPESPLVGNPIAFAFLAWTGLYSLGRSPAFEAYLEIDDTPDGEGYVTYVDGVYAITGRFDTDSAPDALEERGYTPADGETDGRVYENDEAPDVVGVTDDAFVFAYTTADETAFDAHERVGRTIETILGESDPKHVSDEAFDWVLRAGGNTGITCCWYGNDGALPQTEFGNGAAEPEGGDPSGDDTDSAEDTDGDSGTDSVLEFEYGAFEGATAVHQSLTLNDDERASARTILTATAESTLEESDLESALGSQADSFEVTRDGTSLLIESEYGDL